MFALHGHRPRIRLDLVLIVAIAFVLVVAASALSGEPEGAVRLVVLAFATTLLFDRIGAH
ncbi:MAG TPA: hypothetical protein VGI86_04720 [Acidimicrobiia bacterium]|jgi:hypothetical protein